MPGAPARASTASPEFVRKRKLPRGGSRRYSLEAGILLEGAACFLRLGNAKLARESDDDAKRIEQVTELPELALIVCGDDETVAAPEMEASGHSCLLENRQFLQIEKFAYTLLCQAGKFRHALFGEDSFLGASLDLHDHALAGKHKICVGFSLGILDIFEI